MLPYSGLIGVPTVSRSVVKGLYVCGDEPSKYMQPLSASI
jgi:hypothetical protein